MNIKQQGSESVVKDNVIRVDLQRLATRRGWGEGKDAAARERCLVGLSRWTAGFQILALSRKRNFA